MRSLYLSARLGVAVLLLTTTTQLKAQDNLDTIRHYLAGLTSLQAGFHQEVVYADNILQQVSDGQMWIQRPGKFRWDYETPYRQLIVADGERLWTYDEDLEQATVQPVDAALSSTPAMLLSGFRPLEEVMRWAETGSPDGKTWYRLDPKQEDAAVEEVQIAFEGGQLAIIEVRDSFGNHTRIRFSDITRNQSIDPGRFRIQLPPGTDIIGDTP